jgi:sugar transferase (PEP-CTERM/EpsH1 system associated)
VASTAEKRPLRILFIAPYVPSLIRVRPFNLIRLLAERGHLVTACVPIIGARERDRLARVAAYCNGVAAEPLSRLRPLWNCARAVRRGLPLQAAYCYLPALQRQIDRLLAQNHGSAPFDVVHVEHLRAALFGWSHVEVPHVFDAVDCISRLLDQTREKSRAPLGRLAAKVELARTRRFERRLAERFARIVTTSESERQALVELCAEPDRTPYGHRGTGGVKSRITVIPNGVDLEYFRPRESPRQPATLVYAGRMSYHANVTAVLFLAHEALPRIWAVRPEVRLVVVGEQPHRHVRSLVRRHPSRVTVTGAVPDVRPYLAEATVSVAPILYGVGVQNKVLEAMAMGTPVVCSPAGCSALDTRDGEDLLVARDADGLATAVLRLLADPALQARLSRTGRAYVERHHDWRRSVDRLEAVYYEEIARSVTREGVISNQ